MTRRTRWQRRMWMVVFLVGVAAGVGGGVHLTGAGAQAPFPEGAFVTGADGTPWVVANGVRYRMAFAADEANLLPGLRESATVVATVGEAQAAIGADAPPPPGPANPAETLIGQRVRACNYGVDFEIGVTRVEWTKTVIGQTAAGNGMWIVAIIDVTNLSTKAESLTTRPLQVRDAAGRQYNVREYPPDPVDLFRAYEVHAAFQNFEPGITELSVVTFQVPDNVGPLTLVGKRDFC